jgi:hypothetical protein
MIPEPWTIAVIWGLQTAIWVAIQLGEAMP